MQNWWQELILNLLRPLIIVMDNASYHFVQISDPPTLANRIADIKECKGCTLR